MVQTGSILLERERFDGAVVSKTSSTQAVERPAAAFPLVPPDIGFGYPALPSHFEI